MFTTLLTSALIARVLKSEQAAKSLGEHGFVVAGSTPEAFRAYIKKESDKYARLDYGQERTGARG